MLKKEDERGVTLAIASYLVGCQIQSDSLRHLNGSENRRATVDAAVEMAELLVKRVLK